MQAPPRMSQYVTINLARPHTYISVTTTDRQTLMPVDSIGPPTPLSMMGNPLPHPVPPTDDLVTSHVAYILKP